MNFIKTNRLALTQPEIDLCELGIKRMRESLDRHHEETHVFRMLENYVQFKNSESTIKDIDCNETALIIAICWHDTWKSSREFRPNIAHFIVSQLYEGIGSWKLFSEQVKDSGINKKTLTIAKSCILKHQGFKLSKNSVQSQTELKILRDLDALESSNLEFFSNFEQVYSPRFSQYPRFIKYWEVYYTKIFRKMSSEMFYFDWSKRIFEETREEFIKRADEYIAKLIISTRH